MLWQLLILGMAMGLNNTLAAVALGTVRMSRIKQVQLALLFGLFEAGMPLIGLLFGHVAANFFGGQARWLGIGVLGVMGVYLLLKTTAMGPQPVPVKLGWRSLALALVLSLDNLTVGISLGMLQVRLVETALVFGLVSVSMSLLGLELGRWMGKGLAISTDRLSGAILLAVAVVMVVLPG
ncbi:hypothetical protein D2Q93_12225 [Alicyclobacillaceae bacterium I2511]|nr:hypothetical protein D2Q93_12225 [Alicyclobacillaceae bacterium I2511]